MGEAQDISGLGSRFSFEDPEALLGEDTVRDSARNAFVVYDQDGRGYRQEWCQVWPQRVKANRARDLYMMCPLEGNSFTPRLRNAGPVQELG
jgi:hypothetical protein